MHIVFAKQNEIYEVWIDNMLYSSFLVLLTARVLLGSPSCIAISMDFLDLLQF